MENLFSEFNEVTAAEWKAQLEKDLKGVGFNDLQLTDRNGINIYPFYTMEDNDKCNIPIFGNADWVIVSDIIVENEKEANKRALENLKGGVTGIKFVLPNEVDFKILLQEIDLSIIQTFFLIRNDSEQISIQLQDYLRLNNLSLSNLNCHILYDSIALLAVGMMDYESFKKVFATNNNTHSIFVDAAIYNNCGAVSIYEMACLLAHLNEYLNRCQEKNELQEVKEVVVTLAVDTLFYEQIAKLRAVRNLCNFLLQQYNVQPTLHFQIITSDIYRAESDSYSNLLRDSIAGMAGVLGGCDSLVIHSFQKDEGSHSFADRMSRNQQLIFKEESYLNKVADVANGSYYINKLTDELETNAWKRFQTIENDGGWLASFKNGVLQSEINMQAKSLIEDYKSGKRVLVGVNKYANANDKKVVVGNVAKKEHVLNLINIEQEIL